MQGEASQALGFDASIATLCMLLTKLESTVVVHICDCRQVPGVSVASEEPQSQECRVSRYWKRLIVNRSCFATQF